LVDDLARETFVDWQVPELRDTVATIFLKKIGSGENLFQIGNEQNGHINTYTHVKETTHGYHLVVGISAPSGVRVYSYYGDGEYVSEFVGVAARRKF